MEKLRGIVLAGGMGNRLHPLTSYLNKHLLPVYDKPMLYYPIHRLVEAGIDEIQVVTGGEWAGGFVRALGNGKALGIKKLTYAYQEGSGGIAEALLLCEDFADRGPICVILGDNIFKAKLTSYVQEYANIYDSAQAVGQEPGALILLKQVEDPSRFGVPVFDSQARVLKVEEKPLNPACHHAVVGIYFYDQQVWDALKQLRPSARGELEITDIQNYYAGRKQLHWRMLDGFWSDAGQFDSLLVCANEVASWRGREP